MMQHANNNWFATRFTGQNIYRLILAAIIVRIVIMPFSGHVDVLSEARRIYFWDENSIYFDQISRNATSLFQLFFFKVFSFFIESKDVMFFHEDMQNTTADPNHYYSFVSHDTIFRTLFILKLPFFVADMVSAWAIYHLLNQPRERFIGLAIWLFNPITLFAFYVFGRFESIPVMFCLLSLLMLKREHIVWAAVFIGLSMNSRELFIFYGPLFIAMMMSPSYQQFRWSKRITATLVTLLALGISLQLISFGGPSVDAFGREVSSIAQEGRVDYLFQFIVGSFIVFPMLYFVLLLYTWNSNADQFPKALMAYSMVVVLFFSLSSHTAHYTSWLVAFPALYLARDTRLFKPFIMMCLFWFIYHLSVSDLGVFTLWLASPWSLNLSGMPNFQMLYQTLGLTSYLDVLTFARLARACYCAAILYMAVQMILIYRQDTNTKEIKPQVSGQGTD